MIFKKLSETELLKYIETKEPIGKAGGYAIQGIGKHLVKEYHGSYYNIRGLPKNELLLMLNQSGIKIS